MDFFSVQPHPIRLELLSETPSLPAHEDSAMENQQAFAAALRRPRTSPVDEHVPRLIGRSKIAAEFFSRPLFTMAPGV